MFSSNLKYKLLDRLEEESCKKHKVVEYKVGKNSIILLKYSLANILKNVKIILLFIMSVSVNTWYSDNAI